MKTSALVFVWLMCATGLADVSGTPREKWVVVDKTEQMLHCYEGDDHVFSSRVSTGRAGHSTPSGEFQAGVKLRMHYSTLYHHAPMPYSVQVSGNYFIHGFKDVPAWPASHGCIRMPLDGQNPAAWFFQWVETGTPISIRGQWQGRRPSPPVEVSQPIARVPRPAPGGKPSILSRLFQNR